MASALELVFAVTLAGSSQAGEIVIHDRISPADLDQSSAGRCGSHHYSVTLQHNKSARLSLKVDGRRVRTSETVKVVNAVKPGHYMYEPRIVECFWDRSNARFRLLTGGPSDGGNPTWLSFEVSPDGHVTAVRED